MVSAGLPVKKLLLNMSTDIHPVHKASKLWERVTSLLLSCVSALSLLLVKLDYDFTKVCLLKFLSFLCSHKNSQKSNNFGKRQKWNESIFQIEARFWDQIYLHSFSVKKYFSWCILFWIEQILNYKNVMDENWSHHQTVSLSFQVDIHDVFSFHFLVQM